MHVISRVGNKNRVLKAAKLHKILHPIRICIDIAAKLY